MHPAIKEAIKLVTETQPHNPPQFDSNDRDRAQELFWYVSKVGCVPLDENGVTVAASLYGWRDAEIRELVELAAAVQDDKVRLPLGGGRWSDDVIERIKQICSDNKNRE